MKRLIILLMVVCLSLFLFGCSNDNNGGVDNNISNISSDSNGENALPLVSSEKGYSIRLNTETFEYKAGDKDIFSAKNSTAFLEATLSGGKTVDTTLDEITTKLSGDQYALSKSESIAVGSEFYTARCFTAEKSGEKREYYRIPAQNECLILVFVFGDNAEDNAALLSALETLMID